MQISLLIDRHDHKLKEATNYGHCIKVRYDASNSRAKECKWFFPICVQKQRECQKTQKNTMVYKIAANASVGIKMAGIFLQRRKIAFWRSSLFEDFLQTIFFILTNMVRNDNFLVKTGLFFTNSRLAV